MAVNRILYFYLLLLTGIFFVLFDPYLFHLILVFLLLLPLLSLLLTLPVRRAVRCRMDVDDEIVPKGGCSIRLTLSNASVLPCACVRVHLTCRNALGRVGQRYSAESADVVQMALGPRRTLTLRPAHRDARCGRMDFIVRRVVVCDILGLFSLPVPVRNVLNPSGSVYVLPALQSRSIPIEDAADIGMESTAYSTEKPGGDPSEVFQLRDYREGDSLHSVHWKLSGRMRRLIVREFGLPLNPSLHFLLELTETANVDTAEEMLGTLLAFSEHLLSWEIVHCISWINEAGLLWTVTVTDADALATALHSLLALPGGKRWSALNSFAFQPEAQAQTHLIYLIAGANWNPKEDAEAERTLGSLIELSVCRRITLMPDVCPVSAAQSLCAQGCEVQLLDGRIPDMEAGLEP